MNMTQVETQDRIIAKASEDSEFRARLLADPRAAIQELTGQAIPDGIEVRVHEESATSFHLVLPADGQLSEAEMDHLSAAGSGANTSTTGSNPSALGDGQVPNQTIS